MYLAPDLGFWLAETGPVVKLIGGDAGVSFYSSHTPNTRSTWTVLSNTPYGVWLIAEHPQIVFESVDP